MDLPTVMLLVGVVKTCYSTCVHSLLKKISEHSGLTYTMRVKLTAGMKEVEKLRTEGALLAKDESSSIDTCILNIKKAMDQL